MERSVREQEQEVRDLIRRANATSDKSGVLRRKALVKLIDLTHSSHSSFKILAAKSIPGLFNDFPEQEEAAINAVYDLCEDQSSTVRKAGYTAITEVSRVASKWVKRNTDVLLQLLQSDEPDEVEVVKQALLAHLNLDGRVTMSVLCDQIMPAEEGSTDPDELLMRDRLRGLVLAFLTGEVKQATERGAVPEDPLVDALLAAIPKFTTPNAGIIVKQFLLLLPSFRSGSPRSNALLSTLLEKAQSCFKAEAKQGTLTTARFYMDLMAYIAIEKSLASPIDLLHFYLPSLVAKMTLHLLPPSDQVYIICNMTETLAACEKSNPSQLSVLRNQSVDASPNLFECLGKAGLADKRSQNACRVLLESCLRRKSSGWAVPSHLRASLEILRTKSEQDKDVQELIRSLAVQDKAPATGPNKSKPPITGPSQKPVVQTIPGGRPVSILRRPLSGASPIASTSGSRSGSKEPSTINKHNISTGSDSSPRPAKRMRTESDAPPSLLSRLGTAMSRPASTPSLSTAAENRTNVARVRAAEADVAVMPVDQGNGGHVPRGGFSIKGAAKAASESRRSLPSTPSSLLDRIVMADSGGSRGRPSR